LQSELDQSLTADFGMFTEFFETITNKDSFKYSELLKISSSSAKTTLTETKNKPTKAAKKDTQDAQTVITGHEPFG
jgi:hypothetical protein